MLRCVEADRRHAGGQRIDFAVKDGEVKLGAIPRGIKIETA